MTKLADLINDFGANAFIYADKGNGCAFGEAGQAIEYDDDAAEKYGKIVMTALETPELSDDGVEATYSSEWIDGDNGYSFKVKF